MTEGDGGQDGGFPVELASETIARLYEAQGLPDKAAAIRALCGRSHVSACARDGRLEVTWQVPAPTPASLRLRIVTFVPGEKPRVRDLEAEPSGTSLLESDPGWTCVAIGRHEDERFVPLAHASPLRI